MSITSLCTAEYNGVPAHPVGVERTRQLEPARDVVRSREMLPTLYRQGCD